MEGKKKEGQVNQRHSLLKKITVVFGYEVTLLNVSKRNLTNVNHSAANSSSAL